MKHTLMKYLTVALFATMAMVGSIQPVLAEEEAPQIQVLSMPVDGEEVPFTGTDTAISTLMEENPEVAILRGPAVTTTANTSSSVNSLATYSAILTLTAVVAIVVKNKIKLTK